MGSLHIRTAWADHSTAREHRLVGQTGGRRVNVCHKTIGKCNFRGGLNSNKGTSLFLCLIFFIQDIVCKTAQLRFNIILEKCLFPRTAWVYLPQIFRGASSSSRIGWLRKISRDLRQRPRISFSVSWTFLPGLEPFTLKEKCHRSEKYHTGDKDINTITSGKRKAPICWKGKNKQTENSCFFLSLENVDNFLQSCLILHHALLNYEAFII